VKRLLLVFGIFVLMLGARSALALTQTCAIVTAGAAGQVNVSPSYLANQQGQANEGCTVLITLNPGGTVTITAPNPAPSYESGNDDNMIGVVNNTGTTITSLQLSSAAVDIFGFDGDGICGLPGWIFSPVGPKPMCPGADPRRYGQGAITFNVATTHSGIVNFGNGGRGCEPHCRSSGKNSRPGAGAA